MIGWVLLRSNYRFTIFIIFMIRSLNNMTCFGLSGNHRQIQQTEVEKLKHPYSGHSGQ